MPWMICICGRRFYASPSMMNDARCEPCSKLPTVAQTLAACFNPETSLEEAQKAEADGETSADPAPCRPSAEP
jgi:hypothetical protein